MKTLFTIFLFIISSNLLFSQTVTLGIVLDETAPFISQQSTQISVFTNVRYCRFIPAETAEYTIRSIGSSDAACTLYSNSLTVIDTGDDEEVLQFAITQTLTAGENYYLAILDYDAANTFTLSITGGALVVPLSLGLNRNGTAPLITESSTYISVKGSIGYCRFIPQESTSYTISSIGSSDGACKLYDGADNLLDEGDDEVGSQFVINYSLNAFETYYLAINDFNAAYPFTLSITGGALPVELSLFTANGANGKVLLSWQTETEVNNYGFEVERQVKSKQNPIDNWEKIGFVEGNGNSNSKKKYSFLDENPVIGNLLYRLKQIDTDGSFKYYPTYAEANLNLTDVNDSRSIPARVPTEFALHQNYPNPFNPATIIQYAVSSTQFVSLKVYNILGNEVATLVDENKAPGYYVVEFNASKLSTGMYIYKLTAGNFTSTKKLMLMK